MTDDQHFLSKDIHKLIVEMGWPAMVSFAMVVLFNLIDAFFVGQYIGSNALAVVNVVGTIQMSCLAFGIALGVAGASIMGRTIGNKDNTLCARTFVFQNAIVGLLSILFVTLGIQFSTPLIYAFGGKGEILSLAHDYYSILVLGLPMLLWGTMSSTIIQALGKPKTAMSITFFSLLLNSILDAVFIVKFGWGLEGAAWASFIAYILGTVIALKFFIHDNIYFKITRSSFKLDTLIAKETALIGVSVLLSVLVEQVIYIVVNHLVFQYYQETGVAIIGITLRVILLLAIIAIGIENGVRPIFSHNYGAEKWHRITATLHIASKHGFAANLALSALVLIFADSIIALFSSDPQILSIGPYALRVSCSLTALSTFTMILNAYYIGTGKANKSLFIGALSFGLVMTLLFTLSNQYGFNGLLIAFPITELIIALVVIFMMFQELKTLNNKKLQTAAL